MIFCDIQVQCQSYISNSNLSKNPNYYSEHLTHFLKEESVSDENYELTYFRWEKIIIEISNFSFFSTESLPLRLVM